DEERELVDMLLDQLLELEHDARARHGRGLRPAGEGFLRVRDDALDLGFRSERNAGSEGAAGRVEHVAEAAALAIQLIAADEVAELSDLRKCCVTGIHGESLGCGRAPRRL